MGDINRAMTAFIVRELGVDEAQAQRLRTHYWRRYGATLLGLMRHHGVRADHFLAETHDLPGLEARLRSHAHDVAALRRLRGRKFVVTNAPALYAERVLRSLGLRSLFEAVISIEQMRMFGHLRPKPDVRMFRALSARLRVRPHRCVLVEDTLAHQKAARRLGMRTVWMQRWLLDVRQPPHPGAQTWRKPAYVCDKIRTFQRLLAFT